MRSVVALQLAAVVVFDADGEGFVAEDLGQGQSVEGVGRLIQGGHSSSPSFLRCWASSTMRMGRGLASVTRRVISVWMVR